MSDSSSSEDEQLKQLKEAVDAQFIDDSMYNNCSKDEKQSVKPETNKSLRKNISDEDEQFNLFKTTPEFRNFVAKHLENKLEENLRHNLKTSKSSDVYVSCDVTKKRPKSRVRLLSNSNVFLKVSRVNDKKLVDKHNKINKRNLDINSDEETEKIKSVVVDGDFILSQVDVKYWKKRNKETYKVEHYKKDNKGGLIHL